LRCSATNTAATATGCRCWCPGANRPESQA
jgi:hypothetical protein